MKGMPTIAQQSTRFPCLYSIEPRLSLTSTVQTMVSVSYIHLQQIHIVYLIYICLSGKAIGGCDGIVNATASCFFFLHESLDPVFQFSIESTSVFSTPRPDLVWRSWPVPSDFSGGLSCWKASWYTDEIIRYFSTSSWLCTFSLMVMIDRPVVVISANSGTLQRYSRSQLRSLFRQHSP
ncbi:hypothetical protein P170DRAFT_140285 [Aspergillus steynii IBT 23096]|uniref:Uncharacterized protein n=1 Tax=Aspergillus steynii IBT 23096 TaxID=1392250 RepID=A0A2I2GBK3_9EURO|nr:uncharacterized protein P170DRAFT_140285 [Aspergillus steynii IBT 23096]PLB50260.1 hypothetical protein P170DRAFT_140285 [Aspergillus steynii IBT 23096]